MRITYFPLCRFVYVLKFNPTKRNGPLTNFITFPIRIIFQFSISSNSNCVHYISVYVQSVVYCVHGNCIVCLPYYVIICAWVLPLLHVSQQAQCWEAISWCCIPIRVIRKELYYCITSGVGYSGVGVGGYLLPFMNVSEPSFVILTSNQLRARIYYAFLLLPQDVSFLSKTPSIPRALF